LVQDTAAPCAEAKKTSNRKRKDEGYITVASTAAHRDFPSRPAADGVCTQHYFVELSRRVKTGFSSIKRLYKHARGYNIDPTSRKIASRFLTLAAIVFDLFLMLG
jgi:hypothetical protein